MGADEFARAMIERDEDIGATFPGRDRLGHVRTPDLINPFGHDLAVMGMRVALDWPLRRQQVVFLHDPTCATGGCAHPLSPQPRPDLAISLAGKGRGFDDRADMLEKRAVAAGPLRPTTTWRSSVIVGIARVAMPVCRRPREAPEATDKGGSITAASGVGMENMRFPAQSLPGRLLRKPAEMPKILASRNPTKRFASSRRESWMPAPLAPPVLSRKT